MMNGPIKKSDLLPKKEKDTRFSRFARGVRRIISSNWFLKVFAVLIALCLWSVLIASDGTLLREKVFQNVEVTVTGADTLRTRGFIVLDDVSALLPSVRMKVEVPQANYARATGSSYNPRIDLTRITSTGEQELRVVTTSTTSYGTVTEVSPETITVIVDEYVTNYRIPVSINMTGSYPDGFYGSAPSLDPSVVAVSGPRSIVDQISRIYADFDLSTLPAQAGEVRTALPMRFVDREGNDVESSLLEVTSADVVLRTITVEQMLYPTRLVPLSELVLTEGEPATGYRVKSVTASPTMLLAAGEQAELDAVEALFVVDAVDISNISESITVDVRIQKPTELEYISPDTVTITVEIEPVLISRTFSSITIRARGTANDQSVSLSASTISAVLTGPQLVVDRLYNSSVSAYVDVTGLTAGTYALPVMLHIEDTDMTDMEYTTTPSTVSVTIQ